MTASGVLAMHVPCPQERVPNPLRDRQPVLLCATEEDSQDGWTACLRFDPQSGRWTLERHDDDA